MSRLLLCFIFASTIFLFQFLPVHSQCTTSEELIFGYDNRVGTSPWHTSLDTFVGASKSAGKSTTGTSSQDSTSSFEASAGFKTWLAESSARYSKGKSEHNGNSTTASVDEMLRKETRYTTSIEVYPGIDVQVFQTVYTCGDITIRTAKVRRVDKKSDSMTENDKQESDLATQRFLAALELEMENSRREILMNEIDKIHEFKLRLLDFAERHGPLIWVTSSILLFMCFGMCCIRVIRRRKDMRKENGPNSLGIGVPLDHLPPQYTRRLPHSEKYLVNPTF